MRFDDGSTSVVYSSGDKETVLATLEDGEVGDFSEVSRKVGVWTANRCGPLLRPCRVIPFFDFVE